MIARVVVQQTFSNSSAEWVEGEYVFPLSTNSAVDYMAMKIGERVVVGQIREKEQARREYEQAKVTGRKASLVSQQRPNLFRNEVANIGPGDTIMVELHYVETLSYDQGRFSLRLPTTITPRYIPGQAFHYLPTAFDGEIEVEGSGWALPTDQVPDAHLITPPMVPGNEASPLSLTATIDGGLSLADVASLHHPATISEDNNIYTVALDPGATLTRDVVLRWTPQTGRAPVAAVFKERVNNSDYLLLMLMPPQQLANNAPLPREIIYVIDTSGSMGGVSIAQAREALLDGLTRLDPQDRFNVIEFNSSFRPLWPSAVSATSANISNAESFVQNLAAHGGTRMAPALSFALSGSAPEGFVRQVVFVTDGAVGNESALFDLIENQRGNSRVFTVGIGSSPNSHFMERAAEAGRGSFTYIGSQSAVAESMSDLFYKLEYPIVTNIGWDFGGSSAEVFPARAPDLYAGEPLILAAKLAQEMPDQVIINGMANGNRFAQSMELSQGKDAQSISKLWARRKLSELYSIRSGSPEQAEETKQAIIQLALEHQMMSRHTSFIAVGDKVSRPPQWMLNREVVPNAMPEGNTMAIPQTVPAVPQAPDHRLLASASEARQSSRTAVPLPRGALGIRSQALISVFALFGLLLIVITTYRPRPFNTEC